MTRRVFIDCLNQEPKIFNCNFGSLLGGGILLVVGGVGKGLFFGLGGALLGFMVGGFLGREWFLGNIQRKMYWKLPFTHILLDKNVPDSAKRIEL